MCWPHTRFTRMIVHGIVHTKNPVRCLFTIGDEPCASSVSCVQNFYISKWMMDAIIISFIHICCLPVFSMCIILQLHVRLYLKSKEYTWKSMFICINIRISIYLIHICRNFLFELCPMSLLWCFYVCAATPLDCEYEKTHTRKTWHCPHVYQKNDVKTTANINI